jgi:hypothetical protein
VRLNFAIRRSAGRLRRRRAAGEAARGVDSGDGKGEEQQR